MKKLYKIFIIDDDPTFVFLMKRTFKLIDFPTQLKEFEDGLAALDYLKQIAADTELLPDIILLDISMPVLDGWEFIKEYASLKPLISKDIHIYIVSSTISPIDIERAKGIQLISDLFIKPLAKEKIVELLHQYE